jgi:hypothetical protein
MLQIRAAMAAGCTRFIVDGFPRTREQLAELESEVHAARIGRLRGVIWLRASMQAVCTRASGRGIRFSETEFRAAEEQRSLLQGHFSAKPDRFVEVDAEVSEDHTWRQLLMLLTPPVTIAVIGGSDSAQHRFLAAMPLRDDAMTLNVRELVKAATFDSHSELAMKIRLQVEDDRPIPCELLVELICCAVFSGLRSKASWLLLQVDTSPALCCKQICNPISCIHEASALSLVLAGLPSKLRRATVV